MRKAECSNAILFSKTTENLSVCGGPYNIYGHDYLNRGKAIKDISWVILAVVDESKRRDKQKQTKRLLSDVIHHRNSTYDMVPFTVTYTELHKETCEEVAKALLVVLMMSGGIFQRLHSYFYLL